MWVSLSSSSSGTIDSHDLVPAIESLSLSSSTETSSSSCFSAIDKVLSDIDLLTIILIRLPAKSLNIFKSVSKQWHSFISDPNFCITHFRRHKTKTIGLFFESPYARKTTATGSFTKGVVDTDEYYEVIYDFLLLDSSKYEKLYTGEEKEEVTNTAVTGRWCGFKIPKKFADDPEFSAVSPLEINQSCNGLLCCNRENFVDAGIDEDPSTITCIPAYKTCIYNPTTRRYKRIPPSPFRDNIPKRGDCWNTGFCISLAFDPIKSMDYQVICIWRVEPHNHEDWDPDVHDKFHIEVYSSKTNSWRKLNSTDVNPFYGGYGMFSGPGVYWNGCLHWTGHGSRKSYYFDIEQELVKPLPASPGVTAKLLLINSKYDNVNNVMYLGECGGDLYLIELESCRTRFDILKMEIDYSSWKSVYRLDLDRLVALYPGNHPLESHRNMYITSQILFLEEDEAESLSKLVVAVSGNKVISFDLKEMSVTELLTFPERYFSLGPCVHLYVESLVCV